MTPLEGRYRRLLAVYPADHRRAYEREMLGVLMSGSRPGQRFPGLAEAADLMRAGLVARLGSARNAMRSEAGRAAAPVVALLTALMLLGAAGSSVPMMVRLMMFHGASPHEILGQPGGVVATLLRTAGWLAVVVAILAGRRQVAAALGVLALMAEVAVVIADPPLDTGTALHMAWTPVLVTLCVGTLFAAVGAPTAGAVLGRRGIGLVTAGVLVAVATYAGMSPRVFYDLILRTNWYGLPEPLLVVATALLLAGAWRAGRLALVLLAPALVVPLGHAVLWNMPDRSTGVDVIALIGVVFVLPIVTLAAGAALFRRRQAVSGGGTEVM